MKFKVNSDTLLAFGVVGGLAAAAYLWWQSMQAGGTGMNIMPLTPGDYAYNNAPGGTVVGEIYVSPGGGVLRPMPTVTPNTNPAGG